MKEISDLFKKIEYKEINFSLCKRFSANVGKFSYNSKSHFEYLRHKAIFGIKAEIRDFMAGFNSKLNFPAPVFLNSFSIAEKLQW